MRIYNPGIGRFLSVDPLTARFAMLTPYQYASNSPISSIDLDGEEGLWYVYAKTGVYGPTTAKIVNGTEDGVKATVLGTWDFITNSAWKAETWRQTGLFLEEVILSSSPYSGIYNPNTPRLDAAVQSIENDLINGDAYTRTKLVSEATSGFLLGLAGDKGISKIKAISGISKLTKFAPKSIKGFKITSSDLSSIKQHLGAFDSQAPGGVWQHNKIMIERLEKIIAGELDATDVDLAFATHELRENQLMNAFMKDGMSFDDAYSKAHRQAADEYGMNPDGSNFYTPEADEAFENQLRSEY